MTRATGRAKCRDGHSHGPLSLLPKEIPWKRVLPTWKRDAWRDKTSLKVALSHPRKKAGRDVMYEQ